MLRRANIAVDARCVGRVGSVRFASMREVDVKSFGHWIGLAEYDKSRALLASDWVDS